MASKNKSSDISNWFNEGSNYSMQPRQEAVRAPRPSQIPGLGDKDDSGINADKNRQYIRETDSEYVKLAKRGGLSDLLHDHSGSSTNSGQNSAAKRSLATHKRADWYYHDEAQNDNKGSALTPGGLPSEGVARGGMMEKPVGNYDQQFYDESHGEGMWNMNQGNGDYDDYKQNSEYVYNRADNTTPAEYGQRSMLDYSRGDMQAASDYVRRLNMDNSQDQPGPTNRPPSGYDQRLASGYGREEYPLGKQSPSVYGQTALADGGQSYAARQSPFNGERGGSAYSSASHSNYALQQQVTNNNDNNSNSKMKTSSSAPWLDDSAHRMVNRMKRENSAQSDMSKLLSFGYLDNVKSGNDVTRQYTPDRRDSSASNRTPAPVSANQSRMASNRDVDWPAASSPAGQEFTGRRKPVENDRPDFFRIGNHAADPGSAKPPQYGRRRESDNFSQQDFLSPGSTYQPGAGSAVSPNQHTYGRIKREEEAKPDFFNIGGGSNSAANTKQYRDTDDETDVMNQVAGYGMSPAQRDNHRRQKMDPTLGGHSTLPIRATAK